MTTPRPEDANNIAMRTVIQDEQCHVHLDDLLDWLDRQDDCPADVVATLLREASRLWMIEYKEGFR